MGSWWSDSSPTETEEVTQVTTPNPFRYPPKGGGSYFGSHFIMGGERFETFGDSYLFGDNTDLNFLGSKPVPFPYPAPIGTEPTKALKALIYIRKESIKFVRVPDTKGYNVEFVFDSDCRCQIAVMYFCREELTPSGVIYRPQEPKLCSEPIRFKPGAAQRFTNTAHSFTPSLYPEAELQYDTDGEVYPVVIHCVALSGDEQSHSTTAFVDKHGEDTYVLKPLKQKLFVDGLSFLLQEIYGIENKHAQREGEDDDSQSAECVVCLSEMRDTLILPCRHLCLCHACADSLRYQAQLCPICRSPFRALLQVRTVFKLPTAPVEFPVPIMSPDMPVVQVNSIPGFETIPLIEALNGPFRHSEPLSAPSTASLAVHAARELKSEERSDSDQQNHPSVPIALKVIVAPATVARWEEREEVEVIVSPTPVQPMVEQVVPVTAPGHDSIEDSLKVKQSESCQTSPIARHDSIKLVEEQGCSLPTSPNNLHTIPVSLAMVSTRSSGDSFTSAGSTKQLLSVAQQQQA